MSQSKKVLLTGIRASGDIHLGNYLGAMKPALSEQEKYRSLLFIADLHGLTTTPPAEELRTNTRKIAAAWLACGLDPNKTILWRQSHVPEVLELAYVLTCVTSFGLMERAHSYKDARAKGSLIKSGIVFYPILMAADILMYEADLVPVGKDQAQHLEMTRDMATFFNESYGELLKLPEAIIRDEIAVVPGIDGRKMSKSYDNGIDLFAAPEILKKQVMGIVTDSKTLQEPKNPEEVIVYQIYKLVASEDQRKEMYERLAKGGYGYGDAKKELLRLLLENFDTMRKQYEYWIEHPKDLDDVLQTGAGRVRPIAQKMMERVKERVGL